MTTGAIENDRWVWMPTDPATVTTASSEEWAWAAGLFEGEGCIMTGPRRNAKGTGLGRFNNVMIVRMTDRDVLEKFLKIVGVGYLRDCKPTRSWKPHYKPAFEWRVTGYSNLLMLARQFNPWFGARRSAKLQQLIQNRPLFPKGIRKSRCKRGHPLSGPDAQVRDKIIKNGKYTYRQRTCSVCEKLRRPLHANVRGRGNSRGRVRPSRPTASPRQAHLPYS